MYAEFILDSLQIELFTLFTTRYVHLWLEQFFQQALTLFYSWDTNTSDLYYRQHSAPARKLFFLSSFLKNIWRGKIRPLKNHSYSLKIVNGAKNEFSVNV